MAGKNDYLIESLIELGYLTHEQVEQVQPDALASGEGLVELLITQKVLAQGQLAVTDAVIFAPPTRGAALVTTLILSNTSASPVTGVKLGLNGTAATAENQLLSSLTIPANGQAVLSDGKLTIYDSGGNAQVAGAANTAFDTTAPAVTTPLALGTVGTAATAPHRDHTHQSPGGIAAIVAATAAIANAETVVVGATIPAALLKAGTTLRIRAWGTITSTVDNNVTFNVRLGTTTLTGNVPCTLTSKCGNGGTVTTAGILLDIEVTIRTAGAGGTMYGTGVALSIPTGAAVTQALVLATSMFTPASVAVDTTGANLVELTCVTAAATSAVTFQQASISVVKM